MASTYSTNLAIELIGTGDQAGTWGTTTNSNLGTLIEQSISGYVTQAVSTGTDTTITIPNGSTGVARNMYIELTGTGGSNTNLVVPANKKLYFIFNNSTGAVTVKVSAQTGVSVPTGKKMVLVSNGTDIVNGLNYIADFGTNSFTVTNLTASSGTITNLLATSGSITNLVSSDASATVLRAGSATLTHLSATSATITNLTLTSLVISNLSIASANITTLTSASATITNLLATSLAVSSIATFAAGSAAAPAITTTGDTNTGIFFPAADTIAFTDGGVESMRIDSSGNVGISTGNALTQVLSLYRAGSTNAIMSAGNSNTGLNGTLFGVDTAGNGIINQTQALATIFSTSNTERMRLDSTGLGIGTTSPATKFVVSDGGAIGFEFAPASGLVQSYNRSTSAYSTFICDGSLFTWRPSGTEAMRLTSTGLGIGTSSPAYKLDVNGNIRQSSTALVTAIAGLWEYDGFVNYVTPSGTQRGVVPGMQYYALNGTLAGANVNTAQNVLGVGVTLSSSTRYAFEAVYALSKTAGTTSHTTGIGFGGTATINNIGYWAQAGSINSNGFVDLSNSASFQYYIQTAANTVLNGAQAAASTFRLYKISGTVSVGTGGTFIPQYTLSAAPGGAYTTAAGCWFRIYPIGAAGSNISVGTWA